MRKATALFCLLLAACANAPATRQRAVTPTPSDAALLDDVERRSFHFFWDLADPHTQLVAGALFAQSVFDRNAPAEAAIRRDAETLYQRVEWTWEEVRPHAVSMGWTPENGFHTYDWRGYNEAMILVVLALGSPTHPVEAEAWQTYHATDKWGASYGQEFGQFAPL